MPFFYHITPKENIPSIRKDGLRPMPQLQHPTTIKLNGLLKKAQVRAEIIQARENGVFLYAENEPDYYGILRRFSGCTIVEVDVVELEGEKFAADHTYLDDALKLPDGSTTQQNDLINYDHSFIDFYNYGGQDGYEVIYEGIIPVEALYFPLDEDDDEDEEDDEDEDEQ